MISLTGPVASMPISTPLIGVERDERRRLLGLDLEPVTSYLPGQRPAEPRDAFWAPGFDTRYRPADSGLAASVVVELHLCPCCRGERPHPRDRYWPVADQ